MEKSHLFAITDGGTRLWHEATGAYLNYLDNNELRGHGNSGNKKAAAGKEPTTKFDIRKLSVQEVQAAVKRGEEEDKEAKILDRLRRMGPCPAGFHWFRQGNGWRCGGGQHFVYDDDPILRFDD